MWFYTYKKIFFRDLFILFMYMSTLLLPSEPPEEGIRSHYRWLWATMWLLGVALRSAGRAVRALNHWAISTVHKILYIKVISSHHFTDSSCKCIFMSQGKANDMEWFLNEIRLWEYLRSIWVGVIHCFVTRSCLQSGLSLILYIKHGILKLKIL